MPQTLYQTVSQVLSFPLKKCIIPYLLFKYLMPIFIVQSFIQLPLKLASTAYLLIAAPLTTTLQRSIAQMRVASLLNPFLTSKNSILLIIIQMEPMLCQAWEWGLISTLSQ
ncbi:hypothetical protein FGO68_gene10717 [Halteria grandinella]|uniref:Uncharacterized protein n=1 Tax=Halteria grandinella TaxID=5974 RepID=A0A8J8TAY6_HALGN|nr:hypothetical protein FGO68_gene10717 [Halteria grandinella]